MRKLFCMAMFAMSGILCCSGLDIALNSGDVFKDSEVIQSTPSGVIFTSNDSAGWASFTDMAPDLASSLGYDAQKAAAFEKLLKDNQGCVLPKDASPGDSIPAAVYQNPDNVPPSSSNTTYINSGDAVPYDVGLVAGAVTQWVFWNGKIYPYYWWHQWYWQNHWTYWNGHFYPSHYLYGNAIWHNGQYYPYRHNLLKDGPAGARYSSSRHECHGSYEHYRSASHFSGRGGGHGGRR